MSTPSDKKRHLFSTKRIVISALLGALLFGVQAALSFLPNIEVVTLLIILYTLEFKREMPYSVLVFVTLEGLLYGFNVWVIMYLYVWYMLALVVYLLRRNDHALFWAAVGAGFGFLFGALCSIPYIFIRMPSFALSWWLSGIPYDLIHGVSNFILILVLYRPLRRVLKMIKTKVNIDE